MKKNIKRVLFIILIMIIVLPAQAVFAETLEERLNNLIGPQEQYNTMLSPVYLQNNALEESISAQSGELSLAQTDYVLPGRNGLDLEIKRLYKSGTSNVKEMKVKYVSGAWVDYVQADAGTSSFYEDRYNLGIGMRFSFAGIEIRKNEDGTSHKFLHTEAGDVYRLTGPTTVDGVKTYLPENQTIKDVKIVENDSFSNGQSDGTSFFMMTGNDGKKTYFAQDGRILGIADRYGNTIRFEYITQTYTVDGVTRTKKLISKITDTVGRVVTIEYREDYSYKVTAKNDAPYGKEESYKQSQNPNSTDSGELTGKFQVIVNLPGNKEIVYDKSAVLIGNNKNVIRTRLQRVYDVDGQPKFHYWYEQTDLGFTYTNGSNYSVYNRYENLIQIDFLRTNQIKRYTYNTFTRRLADNGSLQYRKIFEKKEMAKKEYDASKSNFIDRFICDVKNRISYNYTNEADGYGFSGYNENNETYLKDTYRYGTKISFMEGTTEKYYINNTYNGIHELVNVENKGAGHREATITEYDEMKFPKKKETLAYNIVNGKESGLPVSKIENYRYDEFGNLTNYTGPIANRDTAGYPVDTEHTVIYSYAYDKYHIPQLKTWKNDSDTICQIKYDIDPQGNVIRETRILGDNPNTWPVTDFSYDTYGNLIKQEVHSQEGSYVTNYEYGSDLNGKDHKGAYLTRRYTIVEGNEISSKYAYDHNTGGITGESDGNNNLTRFEYDLLCRVVKQIQPDGTIKQYDYLDYPYTDKQIMYTDPEGTKLLYEYDISGNLLKATVYDQDKWNDLKKISYDSSGNKVKEIDANGHSVRFEYNSQNKLVKRANYENDTVKKSEMTLSYIHAIDADSVMQVNITDEEGNLQKYFYDANERLVKTQMTPDNIVFYTTAFQYDYVGNKLSSTDALNNKTQFVYDELSRLVKITDPLGYSTKYTYNALNKVLTIEEPENKITEFFYDEAGRVILEKGYKKGSGNSVFKAVTYDGNNNAIEVKQGGYKGGYEEILSKTMFTYNSMNYLTDEYRKVDADTSSHIRYAYDKNGRKILTREYGDTEEKKYREYTYTYDFAGRLTAEKSIYRDETNPGASLQHGSYSKKYYFDYAGNLIRQEIQDDNELLISEYLYDYRNCLVKKVEPYIQGKNKIILYQYDRIGNLTKETVTINGLDSETGYVYDRMGRLIKQISPTGDTKTFVYDGMNNLIKEISPRYHNLPINSAPGIEYEYDALGRKTKETAFDGNGREVVSYREFDGLGNLIKETDGEGYNQATPSSSVGNIYEYDIFGNITKKIQAQTAYGNTRNGTALYNIKLAYDALNRIVAEEDSYGNTTEYQYRMDGRLKKKIWADGISESYDYDLTGKIEVIKSDRAGNVTKTWNNIFEKPYRIEYADSTAETFIYSNAGRMVQSTDRAGNARYYEYSLSGNLTAQKEYAGVDANGAYYKLTRMVYDEAGNLLNTETFKAETGKKGEEVLISADNRVEYSYDKSGRMIKSKESNGKETVNTYDADGNLIKQTVKVTDKQTDIKRYSYDFRSRLTSEAILVDAYDLDVQSLAGAKFDSEYSNMVMAETSYRYNKSEKLKSRKDAEGNTISYEYDYDGRVTKKTDALNHSTEYRYDRNGNLIEEKNAKNISVFYEYDSLNRLIRKKSPAADGSTAVTRYIYDAAGNLIKEIDPNNYNQSLDTSLLAITMLGISYSYDRMNRRTQTKDINDRLLEYIEYDSNGNIVKIVDGIRFNGTVDASPGTSYTYDSLNRVQSVTDALGNSLYYEYDILGNLLSQTDAAGNVTIYTYNNDSTLKMASYPDGGKLEYTYDLLGRNLTQKDQRGNVTSRIWNALGKIRQEKDPYNNTVEYKYDLNGNVTSIKDKLGSVTLFKYDAINRIAEKRVPLELDNSENYIYAIEKYDYDAVGNLIKEIYTGTKDKFNSREIIYTYYANNQVNTVSDSAGGYIKNYYDKNGNLLKTETLNAPGVFDTEIYEYDRMNRLTRQIRLVNKDDIFNTAGMANLEELTDDETGKLRMIIEYEYDLLSNKIKEIYPKAFEYLSEDSENRDTYALSYSYDELNRLERITRKHDGTDVHTTYQYDELGNRTQAMDELGHVTQYAYDSMNRLLSSTDAMGNTYRYAYDLAGNKISEVNANGYAMSYSYDKLNRLETVTDPYHVVVATNSYDANGNLIESRDAKGNATKYAYDLANKVIKVTDPEAEALGGFTVSYEYNQYGEKIGETDGLGNATGYEYDRAGRLIKVTDALGISTLYTYDKAGNKLSMTDGRGKTTSYGYGAFGMLKSMTDADNKTMHYSYDLSGNRTCVTDRNGNTLIDTYNNNNLVTERISVNTGESIQYSYDALGNRTGMADESGSYGYSYDPLNRLIRVNKNDTLQLAYTYDAIGNIESVTDSKGFRTSYGYDKASRLETVTFDGRTTEYKYDVCGNRESVTYEGGVKEEYSYDKNNRLLKLTNRKPDNSVVSQYSYTYDITGRETSKTDSYGTTNYTYDQAGRVLKVEAPGKTTVYAYDKAGNRISLRETYVSNQPTKFIDETTKNEVEYILKTSQYVYSDTNRLVKLVEEMYSADNTKVLTKTIQYLYDANGNELANYASFIHPDGESLKRILEASVHGENQPTGPDCYPSNSEGLLSSN